MHLSVINSKVYSVASQSSGENKGTDLAVPNNSDMTKFPAKNESWEEFKYNFYVII